jgi:hypothetical protein
MLRCQTSQPSTEAFGFAARAAWLQITGSSDPLSRIAANLGFADQAHMTRAVKALTGAPPTRWPTGRNSSCAGTARGRDSFCRASDTLSVVRPRITEQLFRKRRRCFVRRTSPLVAAGSRSVAQADSKRLIQLQAASGPQSSSDCVTTPRHLSRHRIQTVSRSGPILPRIVPVC